MTNDYKNILTQYISGNLEEEQGRNVALFDTTTSDTTTIYSQLQQTFPHGFIQNGTLQCKNVNGEYNGFIIAYGAYYINDDRDYDEAKGYMLLFDNNFELVQIITEYTSGTDCSIFMKLVATNDGTLVGLDYNDNKNRFIMLNNPSVKLPAQENYTLKLRSSYYLQQNVANISHTLRSNAYILDKDPNSANYLIGATDITTGYEALTQFKINVGTTNEWTNYTFTFPTNYEYLDQNYYDITNTFVYWQDEKPYISSFLYHNGSATYQNVEYWMCELLLFKNNGTTNIDQLSEIGSIYESTTGNCYAGGAVSYISENNFYFVKAFGLTGYGNIGEDNTLCIMDIDHYHNGQVVSMYHDEFIQNNETGVSGAYYDFEFFNINGTICMIYSCITARLAQYAPMITKGVLLQNANSDESIKNAQTTLGSPYYYSYSQFHLSTIVNQYDLYKYYLLIEDYDEGWVLRKNDIIYNYLYYNGYPYIATNMFNPRQVKLQDDNGNIFVRELYNKVVDKNLTEATVQIPNTMLNDIPITKNILVGATNYELVENSDTIEKNIYETLYINYFNTIIVENRNKPSYVQNQSGANRVNNSISNLFDYENMKIAKYRVNYKDNTEVIRNIDNITLTNNVITFEFKIYVDREIDNIELISEDKNTIYQTITNGFVIGRLYDISQDCYVE